MTTCGWPPGSEYTYEAHVMVLLLRDETATVRSYPVLRGVSSAMSDEPVDWQMLRASYDTDEEAELATSRTNAQRAMAASMARMSSRRGP